MNENTSEKQIVSNLIEIYESNDYNKLDEEASHALERFPNNLAILNFLGVSNNFLGKYDKAIKFFKKVCELEPLRAENFANVAAALKDTGKHREAIEFYKKFVKINPKNGDIHMHIAALYLHNRKGKEALPYIQDAIKLDPNRAEFFYSLGESYRLLKDYKKSLENFKKCLSLNPNLPDANYKLGHVYLEAGKYELSIKHLDISKKKDWEEKILKALYLNGEYEEYEKKFEVLSKKKPSNVFIQSISSHASINLNKKNTYNFCNNPLNMIFHDNLKELEKGSYFLMQLHQELENPQIFTMDQDLLFNGKQSESDIFNHDTESLQKLKKLITKKILQYKSIYSLSDCNLIKDWPEKSRLNAWYINMRNNGYLKSHIHENGWLSGVVYLSIPENLKNDEGAIEFSFEGEMLPRLKKDSPKKILNLSNGDLVIFPSSLFHRTIPFHSKKNRICISFDLVPMKEN